jgi:hypothetical protein
MTPTSTLGQVVERQHQREASEAEARQTAFAALAITAGIVATIATAGGAAVVAAGAAGFSAGLGLAQLAQDVQQYRAETAAGAVSLDPALADISSKEPELLPIIMDVVATGMDLAAAVALVRALSPAERALAAEGGLVNINVRTRGLVLSRPALFAEYEQKVNAKLPQVIQDVLASQGSTPNRVRLGLLRQQFDQLRKAVGTSELTATQRQQANDILREARELAEKDYKNVQRAVWRRLRQDPELVEIERQLQEAGDAAVGGRALQVNTQTAGGTAFQPLTLEHGARRSDNPWRYNDPENLSIADAGQNSQFNEALREHGFVWPVPGDEVEEFAIRHRLNDQGKDFAPRGR